MKTVEDIFALGSLTEIVKELTSTDPKNNYNELVNEYDPKKHEIFDAAKRPDKIVSGKTIFVSRIGFNYQKKIVEAAVSFLFANKVNVEGVNLDDNGNLLKDMVLSILEKNKIYSANRKLARILFKETEVAEYWYPVEDENFWKDKKIDSKIRLRFRLFSQSNGDSLYPYFNEYGDLIAFSRGYKLMVDKKEIEHLDVFTAETIISYFKDSSEWKIVEGSQTINPIKKIPIVYYTQDEAEWADVQSEISRIENLTSNFADTNDYFGSPMIKLKGDVKGFPGKGETGKVVTLSEGGDADYLTWNQAPESIKTEYEILRAQVYSGTNTPNLSFDNLKNLGNISGVTLKLMFLDAHLKAQNKLEIFDEAFARRMAILKAYCGNIKTSLTNSVYSADLTFVITPFLPENTSELYQNLSILSGGKQLISHEKAVGMTGLVEDIEAEMDQIKKDYVHDFGESFL